MRILLATLLLLTTPSLAWAHTGHGELAGFLHGFEHPVAGLDHVLAMLAVGVFAYVLGGPALLLVPLSFVGMMLVGFVLGLAQFDLPWVELGIALSSIAIGSAAALNRSMPITAAAGLVGAFAVFHGHAHGAEMPASVESVTYTIGFLLATALLHFAGIAAALGLARLAGRNGKVAAQCAAGLFAIGGVGILAGWL